MNQSLIPDETLISRIYFIRNQKVMLDFDLAALYGVETKVLKQSVRRNLRRFPTDFMFELTKEELEFLRSQIVTSKIMSTRYMPMAFTEHGVLMLSSTLKSEKAIDINIQIMRIFTKMRRLLANQEELMKRLVDIEKNLKEKGKDIEVIFEVLKKLMSSGKSNKLPKERTPIGFKKK